MLIIDRFEEDLVVCQNEQKKIVHLNRHGVPKEAKEGDVLFKRDNRWIIHKTYTYKRRKKIQEKMDKLWE